MEKKQKPKREKKEFSPEELRAAADEATAAAAHAVRRAALLKLPTLTDSEIPEVLGIPDTLWAVMKAKGECPPMKDIGRRSMCRTSGLLKWVDVYFEDALPGNRRVRRELAGNKHDGAK